MRMNIFSAIVGFTVIFGALLITGCPSRYEGIAFDEETQSWDGIYRISGSSPFLGTGVRISRSFVLTAAHVVEGQERVFVDHTEAVLMAIDFSKDVAILKVPHLVGRIYDLMEPGFGEPAREVGYVGMEGLGWPVVTRGSVSSTNANGWVLYDGGGSPGMSGGPLLNSSDRIVGIAHAAMPWGEAANATMMEFVPVEHIWQIYSKVHDNSPPLVLPVTKSEIFLEMLK